MDRLCSLLSAGTDGEQQSRCHARLKSISSEYYLYYCCRGLKETSSTCRIFTYAEVTKYADEFVFLNHRFGVKRPDHMHVTIYSIAPMTKTRLCSPHWFFRSTTNPFVLLTSRARLLFWRLCTRFPITFLSSNSSLWLIWPTMVVSSAKRLNLH